MNTNLMHNILNIIIVVDGLLATILVKLGCTVINDTYDCTAASVPAWLLPWLVVIGTLAGVLKLVINLTRDGFGGLFKVQPPVSDAMTTVVQPVNTVEPGTQVKVSATTTGTSKK